MHSLVDDLGVLAHLQNAKYVFRFHCTPFSVWVELIGSLGIDRLPPVQREGSRPFPNPITSRAVGVWTDEALSKSDETRLGELVGGA